jgi:uncharacterized protein (DUF2249 family)
VKKVLLDARELEHPKPLEMAIDSLRRMDSDSYLYMINRKNPIPLIRLADQHGFQVITHQINEELWHILISKNKENSLQEWLDV